MSRGHFIGLNHHRLMLADRLRMEAYEQAIKARVQPGMRVMDLGTGTGILAMWAARAGAEVVAVEPHAVIEVAKRVAADNRLDGKITFVRGDSRAIDSVDAELVITECMGNFFITDEMQPVLRDLARHGHGGHIATMPRRIALRMAAATLPLWHELSFWENEVGGFDFSGAIDFATQAAYVVHCEPEFVATDAVTVADFPLIEAPDTLDLSVSLTVDKSCTLQGIIGWFDADLADGVVLSTAPGLRTHWGQMVFPITPTSVRAGDRLDARIELAMDDKLRSHFRWQGTITTANGSVSFERDTRQRFGGAA